MAVPTPDLPPSEIVQRLEPPTEPVRAVVDTDAYNEIDDQFAVLYALGAPSIDVERLYAAPFHNDRSSGPGDGMRQSRDELAALLDRASGAPDPDDVVLEGSDSYLPAPDEPVESPAAMDLIDRAHDGDEPLYVVAIGCPVNVASAILLDPSIREETVVVWLGGHPDDWHTTTEFNLSQDLAASRVLLDSGVPLVRIPCKNVAEHVRTTLPELSAHLDGAGELGTYLLDAVREYGSERDWWSTVVWDLAAVAWVVDPGLVPSHLAASPVLTDRETWSRDPNRHPVRVASDADRDGIFRGFRDALSAVS